MTILAFFVNSILDFFCKLLILIFFSKSSLSSTQLTEDYVIALMEIAKRFTPGGSHSNIFHAAEHIPNVNNLSDRQLQMCGFIISLYALGINNKISDSWPTRTYSMIVSWIDGHIVDLGPDAFQVSFFALLVGI